MANVWSPRAPIGISLMAQTQHAKPGNPHGLFGVSNSSNQTSFINAAIAHTQNSISNCLAVGAQGMYWHGFTTGFRSSQIEYQNPTPLPPELEYQVNGRALLDELLDMVHSAGLRSGCLLSPNMPTGNFMTGKFHGMITPRESPPTGQTSWKSNIIAKIVWARSKGMSLFYVDAHSGWTTSLKLDYSVIAADNDECLFMFECLGGLRHEASHDPLFEWGLPWSKAGGHSTRRSVGHNTVFTVDYLGNVVPGQTDAQVKDRIRANIAGDDIVAPFCHYQSRGFKLLRDVLAE